MALKKNLVSMLKKDGKDFVFTVLGRPRGFVIITVDPENGESLKIKADTEELKALKTNEVVKVNKHGDFVSKDAVTTGRSSQKKSSGSNNLQRRF